MTTAPKLSNVVYLGSPESNEKDIKALAAQMHIEVTSFLARRGYVIGWLGLAKPQQRLSSVEEKKAWQRSQAIFWPGMLTNQLSRYANNLETSFNFYLNVLDGASCADILQDSPSQAELNAKYNLVSCSYDESDLQQVERLDFEPVTEECSDDVDSEVWMKASWLSYEVEDASMRFRFSFGMDGYEDVAADPYRQKLTSQLAQIIFPESAIVTDNVMLGQELKQLLGVDDIDFVERIIYFNAPDGGAQFHQDVERGHLGVIFVQMSGRTAWLALSKKQLVHEISTFFAREEASSLLPKTLTQEQQIELFKRASDSGYLNQWLDKHDNDALEIFINRTPAFSQQLVERSYAYVLYPGDVLLLPQHSMDDCTWHSVFCLDEEPGEALSFAMRKRGTV